MWWNITWLDSHDYNGYNGGLLRMEEILGLSPNIRENNKKVELFLEETK